jgi:hypothetical protein
MIASYQESLLQQFVLIITVGSVMTLFAYLISSLAALFLLRGQKSTQGTKVLTPGFRLVCLLAIAYSFWAIGGAGLKVLIFCALGYSIGIPLYLYVRRQTLSLRASSS